MDLTDGTMSFDLDLEPPAGILGAATETSSDAKDCPLSWDMPKFGRLCREGNGVQKDTFWFGVSSVFSCVILALVRFGILHEFIHEFSAPVFL